MKVLARAAMLLWLLSAPVPLWASGVVKGKLNFHGNPLEGAVVYLYSKSDGGFRGKADYRSAPSGKDGSFTVSPAGGRYFLVARKSPKDEVGEMAPGDYYAYYGGNPVVVGEGETIHVGINLSRIAEAPGRRQQGATGIRGKVLADGKPLDRARVTLYQDGEAIFRGIRSE